MSSAGLPPSPSPQQTVRLTARPPSHPFDPVHDTNYQLSASVAMPAPSVQVAGGFGRATFAEPTRRTGKLDPETRSLFHQRLRLCCIIATVPFGFLTVCAATNFIELFSRATVGRTGLALSSFTLFALTVVAAFLSLRRSLSEVVLRTLELVVFGIMGACFAYWQFAVLTADLFPSESRPISYPTATLETGFDARGSLAGAWATWLPTQDWIAERNNACGSVTGGWVAIWGEMYPLPPARQLLPPPAEPPPFREQQYFILAAALITHFNWFALIVFHGMLVPNTLARGTGVTIGLCILALSISAIAAWIHPPTREHVSTLFGVSVPMLALGAGLVIFGTAKIQELREQVRTAREAVRELGQYRLGKKLGVGGMGEVYLTEHPMLKRPCALKRIHPKFLNNAEQIERFKREAEATAQLQHPNTIKVHDFGQADDGTFYYVMEYLPGLSLEEVVSRSGPLPPERVVHLLRQVCGALREAHRLGLVHRDIKPSNILVFPAGSPHDQAKIMDFGLVHTLGLDDAENREKITRDGLIVGTPEYMSPEQASGIALDGRSDLFSLGSVAYYLLTGREAFNRGNPMKTLMAVVNEEPAPLAATNPDVPSDLAAVVKRCLAKPPGERYQSAGEMESALASCQCANRWTEEWASEWWGEHRPAGTEFDDGPTR